MLRPIRPSAPLRAKYEARLHAMIDEMNASISHWVKAELRKNTPETVLMGQDATTATMMQSLFRKLGKQWLRRFDDLAETMADYFTTSIKNRGDRTLQDALRKGGFSVRFQMTPAMRDAYDAIRAENVNLIRSIPQQYLSHVETLVMQSVSQGRAIGTLTNQIEKTYGVTKYRAALIARDQNNKATATMRSIREREIGVTEGVWLHSGGGRHPRQSHKAFSGKRFLLATGHDFNDGFGEVLPGQAINCRCTWKAILPGFQ
jgi:SPP1 gp7 family putative phage head morphogenesis protein